MRVPRSSCSPSFVLTRVAKTHAAVLWGQLSSPLYSKQQTDLRPALRGKAGTSLWNRALP